MSLCLKKGQMGLNVRYQPNPAPCLARLPQFSTSVHPDTAHAQKNGLGAGANPTGHLDREQSAVPSAPPPRRRQGPKPLSSVPAPARYHLALASSSAARHFGRHDQDCARSTLTAVHRNGPGRNRQNAGSNANPRGLAC